MNPTGPARLYVTRRTDTPFQVVYKDPLRREKSGRAKRIPKWFAKREEAEAFQKEINDRILVEGTAGIAFDAMLRADAIAARQRLNAAGHENVSLVQLATDYNERVKHGGAHTRPIAPALKEFLEEKEFVEGSANPTVVNLRNRLTKICDDLRILTLGELTRDRLEPLRARAGVTANSRRNDLNAVSSFCTWLFDKGLIPHHPLKGLRRPKVPIGRKATFSADESKALLEAAQQFMRGKWLGTIAVMLWLGPRPSELTETRILYGRHPMARIEGGKLKGRANRTVPLMPAAAAWLKAAGSPTSVAPINSKARRRICQLAKVRWVADITRHTYISNRLALLQDDAQVAREAGTSEGMIHRHYHSLKLPAEARKWAALRPAHEAALLTKGGRVIKFAA